MCAGNVMKPPVEQVFGAEEALRSMAAQQGCQNPESSGGMGWMFVLPAVITPVTH